MRGDFLFLNYCFRQDFFDIWEKAAKITRKTKNRRSPAGLIFSLRFSFFCAAAAIFFLIFAAADGLDIIFDIAEAVFAVALTAVAVAIEGNLEVLLEESISNSEERANADNHTDNGEDHLQSIISFFHDKYLHLIRFF